MKKKTPSGFSGSEAVAVPTEKELLLLVRSGDASAKRRFYDRDVGYLTAVCSRYVVNPSDVKDVLQDSFIKIFNSLDRFEYRGEGSIRAWVSRIVVNDSLKSLRNSGRLLALSELPEIPSDAEDEPVRPEIPPEELQRMIKALPDGYRTVFNLFVFEKKSHKEIAGMLGIKEDSSASQYLRARRILASKIKDYWKRQDNG